MKRTIQILIILAFVFGLSPVAPGSAFSDPQDTGGSTLLANPLFSNFLFLPLLNSGPGYAVTGRILDENNVPIAAASVIDSSGAVAKTDSLGYFQLNGLGLGSHNLAAFKDGYVFQPAEKTVTIQGSNLANQNFTALVAGSELILNGGFESDITWEFPKTVYPGSYSSLAAYTGLRSARSGITKVEDNVYSYSSVRQLFTIPAGSPKVTLHMWMYTGSTEPAASPVSAMPSVETFGTEAVANDAQYVLVLDKNNNILQTLLWGRTSSMQWKLYEFDLTKWAGAEVKIEFGAINDGLGGVTYLYLDDVSVIAEQPTAAACGNRLSNSGFEYDGAWGLPLTPYPANYSTIRAHTGTRSMRTGISNALGNVLSYSDAYQQISIPANATKAELAFWYYPISAEAAAMTAAGQGAEFVPDLPITDAFGEEALAKDAQYLVILNSSGYILDYSMWITSNSQSWTYKTLDLKAYAGRTIRIQFGTYNNGTDGVTSMFVDDMILDICTAGVVPTPTPTPTPSPTPTTGCVEKVVNGGYESTSAWEIPLTAFSAGYSTDRFYQGTRSLRTGIVYLAHNRFSYSDARQTVTIPVSVTKASLTLYTFTSTGEPPTLASAPELTGDLMAATALGKDMQYILILDNNGNWIDTLLWERTNDLTWKLRTFDLRRFAGQTIKIQFGTYNDGLNGISSMFVDNVSLQVCP